MLATLGKTLALAAVALGLGGCANLATIHRSTELPYLPPEHAQHPESVQGLAIHLDAAQRLFYQAGSHFCAEPMPDALQSLASSNGVGVGAGDKVSAAISSAFSVNAASIGLHTQSTTLMRDQYYRICELAANTNMTAPQVAQLMERSQRYTLGILAVEQLTGAVAANQAALATDANSSAAASLGATQEALNKALDALADRKSAATAASAAASAAEATARQSAAAAGAAGASDDVKNQAKSDQAAAAKADAAAATAAQNQAEAQTTVDTLRGNLGTAQAKADAAAKGSVTLAPSVGARNIDKDTAQAIATATQDIVDKMLQRGDIVDSCMAMMMGSDADTFFRGRADLLSTCKDAIQTTVDSAANGHVINPFRDTLLIEDKTAAKLRQGQAVKLEAVKVK